MNKTKWITIAGVTAMTFCACGKRDNNKGDSGPDTGRQFTDNQTTTGGAADKSATPDKTPETTDKTPATTTAPTVQSVLMASFCSVTLRQTRVSGGTQLTAGQSYLLAKFGNAFFVYPPQEDGLGPMTSIAEADIASATCDYSKVMASDRVVSTGFYLYTGGSFSGDPLCTFVTGEVLTGRSMWVSGCTNRYVVHISGMETKCQGLDLGYSQTFPQVVNLIKL